MDVPGGFTLHICNQQPSITQVLRAVKRKEHGIFNCIASIIYDNKFIVQVSDNFASFPLLANLRAGAWYAGPRPSATCYFKSTDGHSGEWSFSTVRINLHVARLAARHGGVCIVDATRRGKTFPVRPCALSCARWSKIMYLSRVGVYPLCDVMSIMHCTLDNNLIIREPQCAIVS